MRFRIDSSYCNFKPLELKFTQLLESRDRPEEAEQTKQTETRAHLADKLIPYLDLQLLI